MYLSHWVGFDGVTDDEGKHFTIAADRREAELTLERLADLIDPTCRVSDEEITHQPTLDAMAVHVYTCLHAPKAALLPVLRREGGGR